MPYGYKGRILRASAWLALLESGSSSDISTVGSLVFYERKRNMAILAKTWNCQGPMNAPLNDPTDTNNGAASYGATKVSSCSTRK